MVTVPSPVCHVNSDGVISMSTRCEQGDRALLGDEEVLDESYLLRTASHAKGWPR
jgi:hypothetical protein